MSPRSCVVVTLLCSLAIARAGAQEPQAKPDLAPRQALLQKALSKMAALPSCTFTLAQEIRRLPAGDARIATRRVVVAGGGVAVATAAGPVLGPVAGGWADDLLWANGVDSKDAVVFRGRRMIARQGEGPWQLRQGVVGDGQPMPRALDPQTFFTVLARGKLELIHAEVGSLDDRPVEILTVHAAGDDAYDLLWSGLLPDAQTNSMLPTRSGAAAARAGRPKPATDIDVAVWLDPATARVLRIAICCYSQIVMAGGLGGPAPPAAGGAGGGLPPAGEPQTEPPADAKPELLLFRGGLPERKPKGMESFMVVSYDIVFRDHEAAKAPALDAAASELLGLTVK